MDGDALVVQVRHRPGCSIITVDGGVDIATAPQLSQGLAGLARRGGQARPARR